MTPEFCLWRCHFYCQWERGCEEKEGGAEGLPQSLSILLFSQLFSIHFLFAYAFSPICFFLLWFECPPSFYVLFFVSTPCLPASIHSSYCLFLFICFFSQILFFLHVQPSHQGASQVTVCLQRVPQAFRSGMCLQRMLSKKCLYILKYV